MLYDYGVAAVFGPGMELNKMFDCGFELSRQMGYLSGRNKGQKLVGCFQDISIYYQLPSHQKFTIS